MFFSLLSKISLTCRRLWYISKYFQALYHDESCLYHSNTSSQRLKFKNKRFKCYMFVMLIVWWTESKYVNFGIHYNVSVTQKTWISGITKRIWKIQYVCDINGNLFAINEISQWHTNIEYDLFKVVFFKSKMILSFIQHVMQTTPWTVLHDYCMVPVICLKRNPLQINDS